jgi:hypothetical protein
MKHYALGRAFLTLVCSLSEWAVQQAHAGLIPSGLARSLEPGAGGDLYRFRYSVQLNAGSTLNPGDYFTVYDFAGLIAGSPVAPQGWTVQLGMTGQTPPGATPLDDPNIENVTFAYRGSAPVIANNKALQLGSFSMASFYGGTGLTSFTSEVQRSSDQGTESDSSVVVGPIIVERHQSPEPGSGLLLVFGTATVFGGKRSRRRSATTAKDELHSTSPAAHHPPPIIRQAPRRPPRPSRRPCHRRGRSGPRRANPLVVVSPEFLRCCDGWDMSVVQQGSNDVAHRGPDPGAAEG